MKLSSLNRLRTRDEHRWMLENANRIKTGQPHDVVGIRIMLLEMSAKDRREVESRFRVLIAHLLKSKCQSKKKTSSWDVTVFTQREDLSAILRDSTTMRNFAQENLNNFYQKGIGQASKETGLPIDHFPSICPWTLKEILGI